MGRSWGDRDNSSDSKGRSALKQSLKMLERENARLRKEIVKLQQMLEQRPNEEIPLYTRKEKMLAKKTEQCSNSKCGGTNLEPLVLSTRGGDKHYLLCQDCKRTKRVKA